MSANVPIFVVPRTNSKLVNAGLLHLSCPRSLSIARYHLQSLQSLGPSPVAASSFCCIVVIAFIASRSDKEHSLFPSRIYGIKQSLFKRTSAPTGVDDSGPMLNGVLDALDGPIGKAVAIGAQKLAGHELNFPGHTHMLIAIIGSGADRP